MTRPRLRPIDTLLIVLLTPAWAVLFVRATQEGLQTGQGRVRVSLYAPVAADTYPTVRPVPLPGWNAGLEPGDELVALDGDDLAGWSPLAFFERSTRIAVDQGTAPLLVRRAGSTFETRSPLLPTPGWWLFLVVSATVMLAAVLLFVRAPGWHGARRYFVAMWCLCTCSLLVPDMVPPRFVSDGLYVLVVYPLGTLLLVLVAQEFTLSARPVPWTHRVLAVLASVLDFGMLAALSFAPFPHGVDLALRLVAVPFSMTLTTAGLVRAYMRSHELERRQLRWVMLGGMIAATAAVVLTVAFAVSAPLGIIAVLTCVAMAASPLGIVVSVIGYGWLDVDRLISATASYAVVGIAVFGGALALIPGLALAASPHLAIDASTSQWAMTMGLVMAAIPAHRFLHPRIDRHMFAAHHQRRAGFEDLLEAVGHVTSVDHLVRFSAERIDALLDPESIAVYGRDGSAFAPLYVRGRAAPPAFEADSLLLHALERRAHPLAGDAAQIDPFDRAALETLGVSVVMPIRRGETLMAFTCLGRKRSGDIYTPEELAYLTAVANRCSAVLTSLDGEAVVREARAMQGALRRYVPGAIVEELDAGREVVPSEREVSVLFVDIRGYTRFAESRASEEIFSTLNVYTEKVSRVVRDHGGSIVEFNGDGMMAVFGAPRALERKERAAVEAAREVVDAFAGSLPVGVGIATGPAFVGNIRAADRLIWTAVGNTTNLASRLQSLTRELDAVIAIDPPTRAAAGYVCGDFARHPDVVIRGRTDRYEVWTLCRPLVENAATADPAH